VAGLLAAGGSPELVWRLVLVDPPLDTRGAPVMQTIVTAAHERLRLATLSQPELLAALRQRSPGLTDRTLTRMAADYRAVAPQALREVATDLWGVQLDRPPDDGAWRLEPRVFMDAYLPLVRCPVLLVQADPAAPGWPSVLPPAAAAQALSLLSHARLVTYADVGHLVNVNAAARLAGDVAAWCGDVPAA
jgi:hypothetical protein